MLKRFLPNNPFNAAINSNAPSASNPFATMADVIGINIVSVPNYSALPAPATAVNKYYRTLAGENTSWRPAWLGGTYYPEGIYFSDGLTWDFVGEFPYQATQVEVDAGVNDKNFVTPATFDQAAKWGTKEDSANKTGTIVGNEASTTLFAHVKAMVDWVTLLFVPKTRNITINGTTQDLSADRSWTISNSPAGSNKEIQFNDAGSFGSATNVIIEDEELTFLPVTSPATPLAGLKVFCKSLANRLLLSIKGPSGLDMALQHNLYRNGIYLAKATGNSTTTTFVGGVSFSATGTATAASVSVTNMHTQMKRVDYLVTTAATNAVAGFRANSAQYFRGKTSSEGGFFFVGRWGPAIGVATATKRASFGLHNNQSAPTDVQPSTILNQIAMGWDSGDTNIQIMHNDGSGTATKIDLGASFPIPTSDRTKVYELSLFCQPGGSTVYYEVLDIETGDIASGSITTDLPSATTLMHLKGWMSAGGTSSVIGISFMSAYIENDN